MARFYKMDPLIWDDRTAELTLEQEAAYLRLCNYMYINEGGVPHVDRLIAGLFRVSVRKAKRIIEQLLDLKKIWIEGGKIYNQRVAEEIVSIQSLRKIRAEIGAKGGETSAKSRETSAKNTKLSGKPLKYNDTDIAIASGPLNQTKTKTKTKTTYTSNDDIGTAVDQWNDMASRTGLPRILKITHSRKQQIAKRLREDGGLESWATALSVVEQSDFLCGNSDRGWKADIDFIIKETNYAKVLEGKYGNGRARKKCWDEMDGAADFPVKFLLGLLENDPPTESHWGPKLGKRESWREHPNARKAIRLDQTRRGVYY